MAGNQTLANLGLHIIPGKVHGQFIAIFTGSEEGQWN